MMGGFVK